jgi:DNA-binding response OmpR family regulator
MTTRDGRKTVLILDDSPVALEVARLALEDAGFAVTTAVDLTSFEERATMGPDLILIDVQMPEAYGDDLASTLRGGRNVRVPILLFSNLAEPELARRAAEAEVDGWISKNAGVSELVRRVKEILS